MTNLVRGGVALLLSGLFVVVIYASNVSEPALIIATDSQDKTRKNTTTAATTTTTTETEPPLVSDDKKLVKKTVSERAVEPAPAPAGATAAKSAVVNKGSFIATAYCLRGRTASGHGVRRGIIAADPRVLRLGSRVNLGAGAYSGQYVVSDTGGRIKGKKIDIWVPSCAEARRFGRRTVMIGVPGQ